MMWLVEARTTFGRARVRALLAFLAFVPVLLAFVVWRSGGPTGGNGPAFLDRAVQNAVFAALAGLSVTMNVFIPLSVSIVAGDAVAGEASLGTLRYLIARPAGRSRLLLAKGIVLALFCVAAALAVVVAGLVSGTVFFPHGQVVTLSGTTVSFLDGIARSLAAALVVGVSMWGLAAIGLFISTLTDVPIAAMAFTVGIVIASAILDGVSQVDFLHPWLLTNYWLAFTNLARDPVRWHPIWQDLLLQLGYIAVFASAAWARMTTRDVQA
ncbi:MAG TPA: ABC transporter permease subunit [Acidimicrobiales bacterium]|nr:ABC transporter permease subunit [Acidimicrobiales bacterium]